MEFLKELAKALRKWRKRDESSEIEFNGDDLVSAVEDTYRVLRKPEGWDGANADEYLNFIVKHCGIQALDKDIIWRNPSNPDPFDFGFCRALFVHPGKPDVSAFRAFTKCLNASGYTVRILKDPIK